jgi:hypothetical protein
MNETIRIWRSPSSAFGHFNRFEDPWLEETVTALDAYTDEELSRLATAGFNAIWIHGNLGNVVRTEVFPELGKDADLHQQRLNALIERAKKHDIKVMMYCQPPRAIPLDHILWKNHSDVAGQVEEIMDDESQPLQLQSLCTSTAKVKKYLSQAAIELATKVPGLGGVIMITASEYPSHCWARRGNIMLADGSRAIAEIECPRCRTRKPGEVVTEIIHLIRDGIRSVSQEMKIIAWNWSWSFYEPSPCPEIIESLPRDVILLVDFERGGHKVFNGKTIEIDEYSLGYTGPSEQFMESMDIARRQGLDVMAKLQFGTTHEMATVPNLPVMGNVFGKALAVRRLKLSGFMGCWNFGNMLTANAAGFNACLSGRLSDDRDAALGKFAGEYFPGCEVSEVTAAWLKFGEAMDFYPFSTTFLYAGPANFSFILPTSPGPLSGKSIGRSWLLDERGDDMSAALGDNTIEEIISGFEHLLALWGDGLKLFRQALNSCHDRHAHEELDTAAVCWHAFRSTTNFCKIYRLRKAWDAGMLPDYHLMIRDELENLEAVLPILQQDSRFGYHIEAHAYQYDAGGVSARISDLKRQLS